MGDQHCTGFSRSAAQGRRRFTSACDVCVQGSLGPASAAAVVRSRVTCVIQIVGKVTFVGRALCPPALSFAAPGGDTKVAPTNSRILQICLFDLKFSYIARVGADLGGPRVRPPFLLRFEGRTQGSPLRI